MSIDYDIYLKKHIENVNNAFKWLKTNLPEIFDGKEVSIERHDISKYSKDEYEAYDNYFYGRNCSYAVKQEFNKAWLLHIHRNPHHWQHWVLINDDEEDGIICIEMPYNYIIEMICDWWSFSWEKGNLSEIFNWYDEHQSRIMFAKKTRETMEDILWKLRGRLGFNVLAHHGIKGQKWGVRNGPPYPIDKNKTPLEEALESGRVSKILNKEKQMRHSLSHHEPGKSYLYGDFDFAQDLLEKHSGKGELLIKDNGDWLHKERFINDEDVGVHIDENGKETPSNLGIIIYSKTGTHIYPRRKGDS